MGIFTSTRTRRTGSMLLSHVERRERAFRAWFQGVHGYKWGMMGKGIHQVEKSWSTAACTGVVVASRS